MAQDLTVSYDADLFAYAGATALQDGVQIVEPETTETQQAAGTAEIRLLLASLGEQNAIVQDGALVQLNFTAKTIATTTSGEITTAATVAGPDGIDTSAAPSTHAVTVNVGPTYPDTPGDYNGDGKVSIGDLAMLATHYGKTTAAPDWNLVKIYDINDDGEIGLIDLATMARLIYAEN
jgi:hypothetical protein